MICNLAWTSLDLFFLPPCFYRFSPLDGGYFGCRCLVQDFKNADHAVVQMCHFGYIALRDLQPALAFLSFVKDSTGCESQ